jgi:hypothetical protein
MKVALIDAELLRLVFTSGRESFLRRIFLESNAAEQWPRRRKGLRRRRPAGQQPTRREGSTDDGETGRRSSSVRTTCGARARSRNAHTWPWENAAKVEAKADEAKLAAANAR